MFHILVVEDDKNTAKLMTTILKYNRYEVFQASNGIAALNIMEQQHIDLILLDIMMPKMDGYEFTKTLRNSGDNTPILMISAKGLPKDKYEGFLAGTDDYMVKPVDEEEMLFRIKALLRRAKIVNERKLYIKDIILDYDALSITKDSKTQTLPQKEFLLLFKLLSYPNKIFTRLQLMDEIWGMDSTTVDTTVNVHINRLRKRFESWDEFELISIRGIGYKAVIHNE